MVMTKEEYLSLAARRYDAFEALNKLDNFYDYEKEFVSILEDFGRELLQNIIGELPSDKRKKKETADHLGQNHHQ